MRMHRRCRLLTAGAVIWLFIAAGSAIAGDGPLPFIPGEKLTFELRWGFIPAGSAVLRVMPMTTIQGEPAYHFVMEARTNSIVDAFYKYRSRIDAYASLDMRRSLRYRKVSTVYSTRKEVNVSFNWDRMEAHYQRTKTEPDRKPKIDRDRRTELLPGTFDPLSAFYYARMQAMRTDKFFECPVTDGKKCVIARASVLRKELLSLDGKQLSTFLIEPELTQVEGVFEKSDDARVHIWISADFHQIPVRLQSKVVVGSFTGDLIEAVGLRPASPATVSLRD